MNTYFLLLLRLVHIFAGALWVGSAIAYMFFFKPAIKSIGAAGPQFMQSLVGRQRYPLFMNTVSLLTILAGIPLFIYSSGGLQVGWIKTGPGLGFTIGSVMGIAVFFVGFIGIKPRGERLGALSAEIGKSGGPLTPEQAAELHRLDSEMNQIERLDFIMLSIALLTMATARYWAF